MAGVNVQRVDTGTPERRRFASDSRATRLVAAALGFLRRTTLDQRGGARARERAPEASEARMAKRSARAVNGGHDGRSERPASGHGYS